MRLFKKASESPLQKKRELYFETFLVSLVLAMALFVPYIFMDNGYFLFYGDYNVQQVPFYKIAHASVKSGNIFWDWGTDLGANFIGSYSFYLLGSPFFLLTLPFPNDFVPALMGPLFILKFACAGLAAYAFITRFVKNKELAILGGILYAFSGFSIYNIFFNHFHEAIIIFPLVLLSIELLMKDGKRGYFAIMVAAILICNYYFAFGMAIFSIIYVILRLMSGKWNLKLTPKFRNRTLMKIVSLVGEAFLGLFISAIILLPAVLAISDNSRVGNYLTGWNGLVYSRNQIYSYILQCFFFPPDLPARPVFFPNADVKWSSVAGWLPLIGMTGVFAFLIHKKGSWQKRLINISMIIAFIPILNSAFSAFNYSYYARWFFMPILIMVLMTVMALEDNKVKWGPAWGWSFGITLAITLLIGFFPKGQYADGRFTGFGLYSEDYADRFWVTSSIALGSSIIFLLLLWMKKKSPKVFIRSTIVSVCVISLLFSHYFVATGKKSSYDSKEYIVPTLIQNDDTIHLEDAQGNMLSTEDVENLRIDVYEGMDNTAMFFGISGIQAFHSIVPGSVMDFYKYVGVERTVGSRPEVDYYGIRGLTSVKYVLDYSKDSKKFYETNLNTDGTTSYTFKMEGYSPYTPNGDINKDGKINVDDAKQNDYYIYKNDHFIPYGFTYNYYMTKEDCDKAMEKERSALMVKAILLDDAQASKYNKSLKHISESTDKSVAAEDYIPEITVAEYLNECDKRAETACTSFKIDSKGFSAATKPMNKDNLVFFSVPYEKGWSATVDGVEVDVEKVNVGFMAVEVKGDGKVHDIRFNYNTPGLDIGVIVFLIAVVILAVYMFVFRKMAKTEAEIIDTIPYAPITGADNGYLMKTYAKRFISVPSAEEKEENKKKRKNESKNEG